MHAQYCTSSQLQQICHQLMTSRATFHKRRCSSRDALVWPGCFKIKTKD